MPINRDMGASSRFWRRAAVAALLAGAFVVMASVFSPYHSQADNPNRASLGETGVVTIDAISADAHHGLRSLGTIESNLHIVQIYSTAVGPRYSIYDRTSRRELGALLTAEQVQRGYPEIALPGVDFSAPAEGRAGVAGGLMIAEPTVPGFSP